MVQATEWGLKPACPRRDLAGPQADSPGSVGDAYGNSISEPFVATLEYELLD
jgi:hypothetical protein